MADLLAKRGASLPQPDIPVNYNTCRQIINKSNFKEEVELWVKWKDRKKDV